MATLSPCPLPLAASLPELPGVDLVLRALPPVLGAWGSRAAPAGAAGPGRTAPHLPLTCSVAQGWMLGPSPPLGAPQHPEDAPQLFMVKPPFSLSSVSWLCPMDAFLAPLSLLVLPHLLASLWVSVRSPQGRNSRFQVGISTARGRIHPCALLSKARAFPSLHSGVFLGKGAQQDVPPGALHGATGGGAGEGESVKLFTAPRESLDLFSLSP